MATIIGVDGCRSGWIAVRSEAPGRYEVRVLPDVRALWAWRGGDGRILIDVPIGLREAGPRQRPCDPWARKVLGAGRASSVFTPPARAACAEATWAEASATNAELTGRRLSQQAFAITPKIREVDTFLVEDPRRQAHLREVHPEVLFWALNGGRSMKENKKRPDGREERLAVLARHAPEIREVFAGHEALARRQGAAPDDLVDALAIVVAARAAGGDLATFPEDPELDARGLRMEMLYPALPGTEAARDAALAADGGGPAREDGPDVAELLEALERRLLDPEVRRSSEAVGALLADDFTEHGASGRVYDKRGVMAAIAEELPAHFVVSGLRVRSLGAGVALVTYALLRTVAADGATDRSLRSSLWRRGREGWRLVFHQGTPLDGDARA